MSAQEPFSTLSLPLGECASLHDCLHHFTSYETLDGENRRGYNPVCNMR
jgi:ubiquitin C-terminal hydrolase